MRTLTYLEERDGELVAGAGGLLTKARELGGEVCAVLCGDGVRALAAAAARYGADRVFVADDPALAHPIGQPHVDVLAALLQRERFDLVLFENSSLSVDVAAGLSARLDAGVNWDLVDVEVRDGVPVGKRLALGDTVLATLGWTGDLALAVMRRGLLEPVEAPGAGAVEDVEVAVSEASRRARLVERAQGAEAGDASLDRAEIIVAGGRGLRSRDELALLEDLAEAMGGAVAVTMPLVDRGWYPYAHQVGQTGKTVKPRLYLACGISGAIQHRVGMEKAGTVVAINTDATAPIFGFADLGVVADLHAVVPQLAELVRARRGREESPALAGGEC